MPLLLIGCLARTKVDPLCPKFSGTARVRCATKDVRLPGDLKVNESGSYDRGFQFCFQQSPSNSTRPQIDLLFRLLGHRLLHQDIPNLETTDGLEHACHLLQSHEFIR